MSASREHAQRFGAIAHRRVQPHQFLIGRFAIGFDLENLLGMLNRDGRFTIGGADRDQPMERADECRSELRAPALNPRRLFSGKNDPNVESGRHMHPGEEFGYVLEGALQLAESTAALRRRSGPATCSSFRPGSVHNGRNTGSVRTTLIGTLVRPERQAAVRAGEIGGSSRDGCGIEFRSSFLSRFREANQLVPERDQSTRRALSARSPAQAPSALARVNAC